MDMTFEPATRVSGRVRPPGDKSISLRALIAASMTGGRCSLSNLAAGADVGSTRGCLARLGYLFEKGSSFEETVVGNGWRPRSPQRLDAGNSGTTMRLLAGALAGTNGEYSIEGDESLSRRPMGRIAEPLRLMGAAVGLSDGERPPVRIKGAPLQGIEYALPVASAQVKSAVLLAGLQAEGRTRVTEPARSRDHTERLLRWLGINVDERDGSLEITGGREMFEHPGFRLTVPGDISSAAYFLVAAILSPGGNIEVTGVGLNPSRTGILDILEGMGARIETEVSETDPEPSGTATASSSSLEGVKVEGEVIPSAIDELPLVALAATQATGTTVIREAAELRLKESDRVKTLAVALRTLGASIEERPDGWEIEGPTRLTGGRVSSGGDHRIALTMAVAGTISSAPICIEDWECTEISYPGFDSDLAAVLS